MKKALTITLLAGATLALASCTAPLDKQTDVIKKDTVALQATTALTLAGGFRSSPTFNTVKNKLAPQNAPADFVPIETLDVLFNNGTDFVIDNLSSNKEGYEYLDLVSFNIGGTETISYSLYYNLETSEDEFEDDEDVTLSITPELKDDDINENDNDDNDDDDDKYEEEKHYRLEGIALVGSKEYRFISKTESEIDGDETETELKFMLWNGENDFISIKQEIEIEGVEGHEDYEYEEEFHYLVIEDDKVVQNFKLELENEDNELELEVRIDGVEYEITYETIGDKLFIHVEVEDTLDFTYEKVITTDEVTGVTTVDYILQ